ncbi:MAG: M28 family peptidase [Acidobacteria bacterium]|nr:M28 family peptidase [Acidobacteriota bacterium]
MKRALVLATLLGLAPALYAQAPAAVASRTKTHVTTLASDAFEGRLSGSAGEQRASDYIISELQRVGAKPLPGQDGYRVPFEFTAGSRDGGSWVRLGGRVMQRFEQRADIQALSFSDNADVSDAPVVFAGYGIVVPDSQGFAYDSYATLDVKDKVVLVLRYFPEDAEAKTKGILSRYSDLRYKAMAARQHGARAILIVAGPNSPNAGEIVPMSFDTALAGSGIAAASISGAVADAMFATFGDPGKTLKAAQTALDDANPHAAGFEMPNVTVTIHTDVVREKKTGHNILAYLPASSGTTGVQKPWIGIGAHYDHLGRGEVGNSLAEKGDIGKVHHGADDNASGTSAVLALAESLASQPRKRNLLFQFWSGEELGLVGSSAYVAHPAVPLDQMAAYLNFDMVGRMQDNKLSVQATGSSPVWSRLVEQANISAGFDLQVQPDPYQPTDVASFNQASVPCINFFTGTHVDYHKPTDTADKINFEDLDRIVDFAAAIVKRLGDTPEAPTFTKVEQKTDTSGRAGVRIFTGTIPDYSTDVKGLLLSGVIGGGPAEQAGLQKGDVIVEIAGQTITNIYDYTYALDVLKIGQAAKVVYLRNGERRETMLTPAARK